ncbi:hypothetical protein METBISCDRAFT_11736 [Metschnikowia bicuspidata]|uniref:DNA-binding protein RAP1 n=1 Tax=Metschnikowia bicuspidata TaxID=27322 RepID=A0A4P9ZI54_9ASCO|nr:hypothetical protein METBISCDRAFT_11736 [Metschnikowia bicuspidata]
MAVSPTSAGHEIRKIFTTLHNEPIEFYIDPASAEREKYTELIVKNGGFVHEQESLLPTVIYLTERAWDTRPTVPFLFVDDALARGYVVDPGYDKNYAKDYHNQLVPREQYPAEKTKKAKKSRAPTTRFTAEADHYILEQVRMKPRFRTTHKFFEELASHEPLKGHTGNLIRSRYRLQLENKLNYVYKTDEYDRILLDANGQRICVPVESAKTLKTKYTAQDDYQLCTDVIDHVLRHQSRALIAATSGPYPYDEDKFSISISFFDQYAHQHPHHTSLSWRDRYRKFARKFGLQAYKAFYEQGLNTKDGPTPMKSLTERRVKDEDGNTVAKEPSSKKRKSQRGAVYSLGAVMDPHTDLGFHGHEVPGMNQMPGQYDVESAAAVAQMAVNSRGNARIDKALEEQNSNLDDNIDDALRESGAGAGRVNMVDEIDSAIHPNLQAHRVGHIGDENAFGDIDIKVPDSQDPLAEMNYMPRDCTLDDLFTGLFYEEDQKNVLGRILNYLEDLAAQETGKVIDKLEGIGLTRKFVGHILRVTSAHAMYVHEYMTHVFRCLDQSKHSGTLLFVHDRDGFWTPEADEALEKQNYAALSHMSESSINLRRDFLGFA